MPILKFCFQFFFVFLSFLFCVSVDVDVDVYVRTLFFISFLVISLLRILPKPIAFSFCCYLGIFQNVQCNVCFKLITIPFNSVKLYNLFFPFVCVFFSFVCFIFIMPFIRGRFDASTFSLCFYLIL